MAILTRQGGVWKDSSPRVKDGGVWKDVQQGYVRDGGVWKETLTSGNSWVVNPEYYELFIEWAGSDSLFYGMGLAEQKEFGGDPADFVGDVFGTSAPPRNSEVNGYALDYVYLNLMLDDASIRYRAGVVFSAYPGTMLGKMVEVNGVTLTCNEVNGYRIEAANNIMSPGSRSWPFTVMGLPAAIPYDWPFPTPTPTPFRVTILDI